MRKLECGTDAEEKARRVIESTPKWIIELINRHKEQEERLRLIDVKQSNVVFQKLRLVRS